MKKLLLMSIKSEYVKEIFSGVKKYEYRRKIPNFDKNEIDKKVIIYSSKKDKAIVGEFEIEKIIIEKLEKLIEITGIKDKEIPSFKEYYREKENCYALKIKNPKKYLTPIKLQEMKKTDKKNCAPQNYRYIYENDKLYTKILNSKYINTAQIEFIEFQSEEQNNLEEFFQKAYTEMNFEWKPECKDFDLRNIEEIYKKNQGKFWIVKSDKKIIASIALRKFTDKIGELKRFYVLREYQNLGIGRKLIEELIISAKLYKYDFLRLDTTKKSEKAIKLFNQMGFKEIQRYNNDKYAEIFLELNLS